MNMKIKKRVTRPQYETKEDIEHWKDAVKELVHGIDDSEQKSGKIIHGRKGED